MTITSNLSLKEILILYPNTKVSEIEGLLLDLMDGKGEKDKELRAAERSIELTHEQVCFAAQEICELEQALNEVTSAKQAREAFRRIRENSYFEI